MKTKILLGGALLLLSASYIADAATVKTTCGKYAMTVDSDYFDGDREQWLETLKDINEILCGTREISDDVKAPNPDENYEL